MANYSYTNLYVYGPQEELANLFKKLKSWTRKDERKPKTAFGCGWLGFIAEGAGIQAFDLRAGVEKIQFDGKGQLFIKYISADGPQPAFWEALVRKFAPRSWSCYLAEECTLPTINSDASSQQITQFLLGIPQQVATCLRSCAAAPSIRSQRCASCSAADMAVLRARQSCLSWRGTMA